MKFIKTKLDILAGDITLGLDILAGDAAFLQCHVTWEHKRTAGLGSSVSGWERALGEDRECICLGDININHLEWTTFLLITKH